ncbi:pilus assembly protein PilM [Pandoraea sp. ISTKB]|uniref:pilus assembly protein PilM n=1 Tax=Pandoraea sp. ISTKB TaxID=1586708 RepID=UPI000847185A|nr:pilus assembly protein PilM [Pandoraea sp. ISTKB]ODP33519.1 hypothetical protein A9762_18545 [Pandoraea sp. ISTKB]
MVAAILRGVRYVGNQLAAALPRNDGGACGIHFDAGGMQFVRMARTTGGEPWRLSACGSAVIDDGMLNGAQIAKPEALARRLGELLERLEIEPQDLQGDTIVVALPSQGLRTQVIDYPADLPPRALRAWCERRAALLLPGDGTVDSRSRVGVTWAEPGSHRLRLYACEAALADDRVAVLEMAGLRTHAMDAAHGAGRRAFRWARTKMHGVSTPESASAAHSNVPPVALLQIDAQEVDLAVFNGQTCVADVRERFDGVNAHSEALASVVRALLGALPVVPQIFHVTARGASPSELEQICVAIAATCGVEVAPFDPLSHLTPAGSSMSRFHAPAQRTVLTVPFGLALRAMSIRGVSCE